ncbi:hypothetical protein GCM10011497_23450 [Elstera cyanobacteriorum]|uniref:Uncharacterized protein n=2 Tax=Elstera cyanobacteriorum TaxID=2022747 RepID=A0A255XK00_9PROT|nr:hypothetical protein CHR90_15120 [Elstera cyanobacteriorum]GFZ92896.1 hypothetical protein GCM10011497_23450 [Elstera cyanobacteriorum]
MRFYHGQVTAGAFVYLRHFGKMGYSVAMETNMTEFSTSSGANTLNDQTDYTIEARIGGEWVAQQEARSLETALIQVRRLVPSLGAENLRIVSDAENGKRRLYSVQYNATPQASRLPPIALRRQLDGIKGAPIGSAATRLGMLVALGAACGLVGVIVFQLLHMIDGLIVGH